MPEIHTLSFDWTRRNVSAITAWLDEQDHIPLDQVPLASDHAHVARLVRESSGLASFRIEDDPRVLCIWQRANKTAVGVTLWCRALRWIDVVIVDNTVSIPSPLGECLVASEADAIGRASKPLLARFQVRKGRHPLPEILGMILYVPVMCDLHGIG